MKKLFVLCGLLVSSLMLTSCRFMIVSSDEFEPKVGETIVADESNMSSKSVEVEDFDSLIINLAADIEFRQGETSFEMSGPQNVLEVINVRNEDGTLVVDFGDRKVRKLKKLKLVISTPSLASVEINGAASFEAAGPVVCSDLSIVTRGSSEFDIERLEAGNVDIQIFGASDTNIDNIASKSLSIKIHGAGDCDVSGSTGSVDVSISGAGDIDLSDLVADSYSQSISGAGDIRKPKLRK